MVSCLSKKTFSVGIFVLLIVNLPKPPEILITYDIFLKLSFSYVLTICWTRFLSIHLFIRKKLKAFPRSRYHYLLFKMTTSLSDELVWWKPRMINNYYQLLIYVCTCTCTWKKGICLCVCMSIHTVYVCTCVLACVRAAVCVCVCVWAN